MQEITISSRRPIELIDITEQIKQIIYNTDVISGLCSLYIPHATAGILINENESGLIKDFEKELKNLFIDRDFEHNRVDNNARSHILSGFIGINHIIPFQNNKLKLGTWQQIFFVELDGPRSQRKIIINLVKGES